MPGMRLWKAGGALTSRLTLARTPLSASELMGLSGPLPALRVCHVFLQQRV